jgi:hypothetical protein
VVDGSWWSFVEPDEHEAEIRRLLSYSTFAFLRVDLRGLREDVAIRLQAIACQVRFREPLASECALGQSAELSDLDIVQFDLVAALMATSQHCRFHPTEISEQEGSVLLAAVKRKVDNRHLFSNLEIQRVDTSLVVGGLSGARVFLLKPDDDGSPFVAKIDDIERLQEEMNRFHRFIQPWETSLRPELHIHGNIGAILFGLVQDANQGGSPAPTLEECLKRLSSIERGGSYPSALSFDDLLFVVERTIAKLETLNRIRVNASGLVNRCWLGIDPLVTLESKGIEYEIKCAGTKLNLIEMCRRARVHADRLNGMATVHGDLHSRNIVVRDREPFLIDYAVSGPGHPCFDFVRLLSSILFSHFIMMAEEREFEDCLAMLLEGKGVAQMCAAFPVIFAARTNLLSIEATVRCRASAIAIAEYYGGDESDFMNVMFIVACQSLVRPEYQAGVVRTVLKSLALKLGRI